jgi:hypothetical protein
LLSVVNMANAYRIKPDGPQFLIIDQTGETVGAYKTEQEAEYEIDVCMSEDAMWESAKLLVKIAIAAHMKKHGVGSKTAQYWIREAAD